MKVIQYPDDTLRLACEPVVEGQSEIQDTIRHLLATLNNSSGIGLAAIQLGFKHRIFVMDPEKTGNAIVVANPRIVLGYDLKDKIEGCLSFPGIFERVPRYEKIDATFDVIDPVTMKFVSAKDTLTGVNAHVFQHETEHLSGYLLIDHLLPHLQTRIKRKMEKRRSRGWA